jgi:hypothetical protein
MSRITVFRVDAHHDRAALWVSCHGYESRSTAHLDRANVAAPRRVSYGFPFPSTSDGTEAAERIFIARRRLADAGFEVPVVEDREFERSIQENLAELPQAARNYLVADISSMSRARMSALLLAVVERRFDHDCELDLIYFPGLFSTHKHQYEPLEHFGPAHPKLSGWPADPDLPLSVVLGLGTEPRRADGIVEMLEPDILALYMPVGDEPEYQEDIRRENRRVLEVGGEPILYSLREPADLFASLVATGSRLAQRSRVVFVPLGPKIFTAVTIAAAMALGREVGVWKASAGRGVEPVDVHAADTPVVMRVVVTGAG